MTTEPKIKNLIELKETKTKINNLIHSDLVSIFNFESTSHFENIVPEFISMLIQYAVNEKEDENNIKNFLHKCIENSTSKAEDIGTIN